MNRSEVSNTVNDGQSKWLIFKLMKNNDLSTPTLVIYVWMNISKLLQKVFDITPLPPPSVGAKAQ